MKMNLGGITPLSTIDWPGKLAATIFFRHCNLRCIYCQNYSILEGQKFKDADDVVAEVLGDDALIEAVVLSGGEPCMQPSVVYMAKEFKKAGLMVGLHTNGTYPARVEELLPYLDMIAVDIKAPLNDTSYKNICFQSRELPNPVFYGLPHQAHAGTVVDRIKKTIEIVDEQGIDIEFRTTVFQGTHHENDIAEIAKWLSKNVRQPFSYVIQQGQPKNAPPGKIRELQPLKEFGLVKWAKAAEEYVDNVKVRVSEPTMSGMYMEAEDMPIPEKRWML